MEALQAKQEDLETQCSKSFHRDALWPFAVQVNAKKSDRAWLCARPFYLFFLCVSFIQT